MNHQYLQEDHEFLSMLAMQMKYHIQQLWKLHCKKCGFMGIDVTEFVSSTSFETECSTELKSTRNAKYSYICVWVVYYH